MAAINLPLSIVYETEGPTPIPDIVAALQGANLAIHDAVALLPSLIDGLHIERARVSVRQLSQESPLRELLLVALLVAFQDDLEAKIPPAIEDLFKVSIPESYESIVTIVTLVVLFYGAAFLKDAALKAVEDGDIRHKLNALVAELSGVTGRSEEEIKSILDAKFGRPKPIRRLVRAVRGFFKPSQREGGSPIIIDRERLERDLVRQLPFPNEKNEDDGFERYRPYKNVRLEIHAQDKDRMNTGWAAVPVGIADQRLKMKLIDPVTSDMIWTKGRVVGDIVLVSKLTAYGYVPSEIHLTNVCETS